MEPQSGRIIVSQRRICCLLSFFTYSTGFPQFFAGFARGIKLIKSWPGTWKICRGRRVCYAPGQICYALTNHIAPFALHRNAPNEWKPIFALHWPIRRRYFALHRAALALHRAARPLHRSSHANTRHFKHLDLPLHAPLDSHKLGLNLRVPLGSQ